MSHDLNYQQVLKTGLDSLGLTSFEDPLLNYVLLLNKWNTAYNLTAIRDLPAMIHKHILDSLAILPWIQGQHLIDVGTGAGLPGIPLAITKPEFHFVLLDSNGKKIRFLNEVKRQLGLKNLEVIQSRVENYHPTQGFDTVTSRAFSSLEQMVHWTEHLLADQGIWLAMKGRYPDTELNLIHHPYQVKTYRVEGIDAERCCVIIKK